MELFIKDGYLYDAKGTETSVVIPDTVKEIGRIAFSDLQNLEEITIPDSVEKISEGAFRDCKKLKEVIIPDSVKELSYNAFENCESLTKVKLPKTLPYIDRYLFSNCINLKTVILPENLEYVGSYAFNNCEKLENIKLPDTVDTIQDFAFWNCKSLTSFYFPASLTSIRRGFLGNCNNLKNIELNKDNKHFTFENGILYEDNGIIFVSPDNDNFTMKDDAVDILDYALAGCDKIKEAYINATKKNICAEEFYGCSNLKSITVSEDNQNLCSVNGLVYSKDKKTLLYCPNTAKDVVIPEGTLKIGRKAFYCNNLMENVELPDSITTLSPSAFTGCKKLKSVKLPIGMTELTGVSKRDRDINPVSGPFEDCESLEYIYLHKDISTIGHCAFYKCNNLKKIFFENRKVKISYYQFFDYDIISKVSLSFYPAQLSTELKEKVLPSVFKYLLDKDNKDVDDEWRKTWIKYLKTKRATLNDTIIENPDALHVMTEEKLIDAEQLSVLIKKAEERSLTEIVEKLQAYSSGTFTKKDIEKAAESSSENNTSVSNMKKFWIFKPYKEGELILTSYKGESPEVVIPSVIGNDKVTALDSDVFNPEALRLTAEQRENRKNITSIRVPSSIKSLSEKVFRKNINIKEIYFEDGLSQLPDTLFMYLNNLTKVRLPETLTELSKNLFYNCTSLQNIHIPNNVKKIDDYAFVGCSSLTNITLPDGVTEIGNRAFANCTSLKKFEFPKSVKKLGTEVKSSIDSVIFNCSNIEEIIIHSAVEEIKYVDFTDCKKLKNVNISPENKNYTSIDGVVYTKDLKELIFVPQGKTEVNLPQTLTTIKKSAFYNCVNLKEITLTENIKTIEQSAFNNCKNIESINIPQSTQIIDSYAFSYCENLKEIIIPENVEAIGKGAFERCYNLRKIKFSTPFDVSEIFDSYNLNKIAKYILPEQLNNDLKKSVLTSVINVIATEKDYDDNWKKEWLKFVKTRKRYILNDIFENENVLTVLTSEKMLTMDDVKKLTSLSAEKQTVNITAALLEYQNKTFSMDDVLKSATDEFKVNLKVEDPNSASYLKKIWTVKKQDDGTIEIVNYKGSDLEIEVPSVIGKDTVTKIGAGAFSPEGKRLAAGQAEIRKQITSIIIPDTVTDIAYDAFQQCESLETIKLSKNLKSIGCINIPGKFCDKHIGYLAGTNVKTLELPETLEEISDYAFYECYSLESIVIPNSIKSIGEGTFYYCGNLKDVTLPETLVSIGNSAFHNTSSLKNISIPDNITEIGNSCFTYSGIENIKLPKNLKTIGPYCFNLTKFKNILIPDGVTTIGDIAFSHNELNLIVLPDTVTSIGSNCFSESQELTNITLSKNLTEIPDSCFSESKKLKSINIPSNIKTIKSYAFAKCENLETVTFEEGIETLESGVFQDCPKLKSLILPDSVTSIGSRLVTGCTNLEELHLPNKLKSIVQTFDYNNNGIIQGCEKITKINLPESIEIISKCTFKDCTQLTEITLGNNITAIEEYTFKNCTGLSEITIPNSVKTIKEGAFYGCSGLTSITLPENLEQIGTSVENRYSSSNDGVFKNCNELQSATILSGIICKNTFFNCEKLEKVIIGKNVKEIHGKAFTNCKNIKSVEVDSDNENYKSLDNVIFSKDGKQIIFVSNSYEDYNVLEGVTEIGEAAFGNCSNLKTVNLPEKLETISDSAFENCTELKEITIYENAKNFGKDLFKGCDNVTIIGKNESPIEFFARQNGLGFREL